MINKIYSFFSKSDVIQKYLTSYASLLIQLVFFFLAWHFDNRVFAIVIISIVVLLNLLFSKNGLYLTHLILFDMISYFKFPDMTKLPITIIVEALIILVGFVGLYLKKVIISKTFDFSFGSMGISLSLLGIWGLISSIVNQFTYDTKYSTYGYLVSLCIIFIVFIYLLIVNTSLRDNYNYVNKLMYAFFIGILMEIIRNDITLGIGFKFLNSEEEGWKLFCLGWSYSRNITLIGIEICLPFLVQDFNLNKKRVDSLLLFIIGLILIVFSYCRGAFITTVLMLIFYCFILAYKQKNVRMTLKNGMLMYSTLIVIGMLCVVLIPDLRKVVGETLHTIKNLTGRDILWEHSINYFTRSPIVGSSYSCLYDLGDVFQGVESGGANNVVFCLSHNTFITFLAALGIVGVFLYIVNIVETLFASIVNSKKEMILPLVSFIVMGLIHGLIDNTFFSPVYFFPLMIIYSQKEQANIIDFIHMNKKEEKLNCKMD